MKNLVFITSFVLLALIVISPASANCGSCGDQALVPCEGHASGVEPAPKASGRVTAVCSKTHSGCPECMAIGRPCSKCLSMGVKKHGKKADASCDMHAKKADASCGRHAKKAGASCDRHDKKLAGQCGKHLKKGIGSHAKCPECKAIGRPCSKCISMGVKKHGKKAGASCDMHGKTDRAKGRSAFHKKARSTGEPRSLSTNQLRSLLESNRPVTVLDARTGIYDDGKRIPGARALNSKSSEAEIASIVPDRDSIVVTYCANLKCPASSKLAHRLKELGYTNVIEYPFGIQGWIQAGQPIHHTR